VGSDSACLDWAADRLPQEHFGVSYRRFFVLFAVEELGSVSQRALAQRLDVSEPSVSRMVGVLQAEGLLGSQRFP